MENISIRSDWQGKLIGRYQLEKLLGRGATSEVWLATDTQLRRQVAIKILPTSTNNQAYLRDFIYEARAAASLEHPHILGIHDFGEQELEPGEVVPYLVLPYVAGGTLAARMKEVSGPLPIQESLRYLRQAALAIDYAHSKRILHRDIKPANMLLRDDWLLLTDFGLAKVLGGTMQRGQTYAGSGTPAYMASEQIMGQAIPASDRYSLAVVAYQLFTGRTPFHGATPAETIAQQMHSPLPPPRSLNPQIPVTVENLLMVALSRNTELRPPSCLDLVNALQRAWMAGKQTEPNPDATLLAPWSKRLQDQLSALGPHSESGLGAEAPAWLTPPATSAPMTAVLPGVDNQPSQMAGNLQTLPDPNSTSGPPTPPDPFATDIGSGAVSMGGELVTPTYQPGLLERKVGRRSIVIGGAVAAVAAVAVGVGALAYGHPQTPPGSPKGSQITSTPAGPLNLVAGTPVLQLTGHTGAVWTASWHPGGRYLMTAAEDGNIMLWDIATALKNTSSGAALTIPFKKWTVAGIKFQNVTDGVCWSKDGKYLVVGQDLNDKAYVLDAFGSASIPTVYKDLERGMLGDTTIYGCVAAGPTNAHFTIINSLTSGSQLQTWRLGQTDLPEVNYDVPDEVYLCRWSSDSSMLAAITGAFANKNGFYLWDKAHPLKPRYVARPQRNKFLTFAVIADTIAWSPTDPHLLLVSDADQALIWDVRKDQPLLILNAAVSSSIPVISKLSWSPNGRYVAGSYDPTGDNTKIVINPQIMIWDIQTLLKQAIPGTPQKPSLTFSPSAGALVHSKGLLDLSWSRDGRYLATSSLDNTVLIWQVDR